MNEIGTYGTYTVDKIAQFLYEKMAFGDETLKHLLNQMINNTNQINLEFGLQYGTNEDTMRHWIPLNLTTEQQQYIDKFKNVLTPLYDTPHLLKSLSNAPNIGKKEVDGLVQGLVQNQITLNAGSVLYHPSFSPNPNQELPNYWFSSDVQQAAGYILNKAYNNQIQIDNTVSGAVFIHSIRVTKNLTLLNVDMKDIRYVFREFTITENMLTYHMDVVGDFLCNRVNKLLKKYKNIQFDGLVFNNNAKSVVLCQNKWLENGNSLMYVGPKNNIYPPNQEDQSISKQSQTYSTFYKPPRIYIHSAAALYRQTLTEIMKKDMTKKGHTVGSSGVEPIDVNTDLVSVILASITNTLRPYVYQMIAELNKSMEAFGQFIVAGGDAINMLIEPSDRAVSPDIDTKFILYYKEFFNKFSEKTTVPNQQLEMESEYFLMYLLSKQHLWYTALESVLNKWNNKEIYSMFYWSLLKPLEKTVPFNILGVTFIPPNKINEFKPFRKRLTIMPKSSKKNPPFLFDVDLFAIDVYINSAYLIKWTETDDGTTKWETAFEHLNTDDQVNITGLLDMPYTKPTHLGYNLGDPRYHTQVLINPFAPVQDHNAFFGAKTSLNYIENIQGAVENGTLPPVSKMIIPIANVNYVKHDVSLLHRLELRKGTKLKKDQERLKLLERYASGQAVQLDKKDQTLIFDQIDNIDIKFTVSNIAGMRIGHIIKFLAIPKVFPNNIQNERGFIDCSTAIPFETRFDTFRRFNYDGNVWQECCDIIPNQFDFRYNSKELSKWAKNPIQRDNMICILTAWNDYLIYVKKLPENEQLLRIGVMLYGFRPDFLRNPKYTEKPRNTINLFVNCIMIIAVGMKYIGGTMGKLTSRVYNNIRKLRK